MLTKNNLGTILKLDIKQKKKPLRVIELDEINEKAIGSLMMFLFLETIFSCYFIDVDPFNQPAVEEGKILSIGVLKGLLFSITYNRINYINGHSVANERGIAISYSHSSESIAYTNSIKSIVQLQNKEITIEGSVFSDNIFRLRNEEDTQFSGDACVSSYTLICI